MIKFQTMGLDLKVESVVTYCCDLCGSSSVVEHRVANAKVEGSNPFSRSNFLLLSHERYLK